MSYARNADMKTAIFRGIQRHGRIAPAIRLSREGGKPAWGDPPGRRYGAAAIFWGMAVMKYTEAFFTQDLDILVVPKKAPGPVSLLTSVFSEFTALGYKWKGGHILVQGLPVQFMAADELEEEAVASARRTKIGGLLTKVLSPEYLVALSVRAGRAKDRAKVALLMTQARVDLDKLDDILDRYGLKQRYGEWQRWLGI